MKYVCIRECFAHAVHWVPGDVLTPGLEPNKHFAPEGAEVTVDEPILVAGDDPRSTPEIAKDIEARGGKLTAKTRKNRKKLFQIWVDIKDEPLLDGSKPKKKATAAKQPTEKVTPMSKLSPDQIDGLKCKEIGEMYGLLWPGKTKDTLIKEALAKEAN